MKRDPIAQVAWDTASAWEKEADERERRAPGVPDAVAATLKSNAAELRTRLEEAEREHAFLSIADYAQLSGASESTVRRLCAQGLIDGAERDVFGDWRIPRGAKRLAHPRSDVAVAS